LLALLSVIGAAAVLGLGVAVAILWEWQQIASRQEAMDKVKVAGVDQRPRERGDWRVRFKAGSPDDYDEGRVDERYKGVKAFLVRLDGRLFALGTWCGCAGEHHVNWLEAEQKFKCPNCGGGFKKDGTYFEGGYTHKSLDRLAITIADDGRLEVNGFRSFHKEDGQWDDPGCFVSVGTDQDERPTPQARSAARRTWQLALDREKIGALGLDLPKIHSALGRYQVSQVAWKEGEPIYLTIVTLDPAIDSNVIEETVIATREGIPIHLRDIGIVQETKLGTDASGKD
jgi:hypothetical protein